MESAPSVFVTGAAAATCCGLGAQALWDQLARGPDSAGPRAAPAVRRFAPSTLPTAGQRPLPDADRLTAYILAAVDHDLGAFLTGLSDQERECIGVTLGSAYGHLSKYLAYFEAGTDRGYQLVNPRHFPTTLPNWSTVSVSDAYSLWGSSTPVATGLSAGLEAIAYAAAAIRSGEEQAMIAGGYDEINLCNASVLATITTTSPAATYPVAGEGVGILLLQSADAVAASGRRPLAAYGATVTRRGLWWDAPDARARAAQAVRDAVSEGGVLLTDIVAVFPSTNGDARRDDFEAQVLREVLCDRLRTIDIVPIKAVTGECFGAAGPLQCVAAVHYLACAAHTPEVSDTAAALVCSSGYDGTFAATVFRGCPA